MPTFVYPLLHRLLLVIGPSALIACGGRGELETPHFENGGSAGTNSICGNHNSIPRVASSDPDEKRFDCGPPPRMTLIPVCFNVTFQGQVQSQVRALLPTTLLWKNYLRLIHPAVGLIT